MAMRAPHMHNPTTRFSKKESSTDTPSTVQHTPANPNEVRRRQSKDDARCCSTASDRRRQERSRVRLLDAHTQKSKQRPPFFLSLSRASCRQNPRERKQSRLSNPFFSVHSTEKKGWGRVACRPPHSAGQALRRPGVEPEQPLRAATALQEIPPQVSWPGGDRGIALRQQYLRHVLCCIPVTWTEIAALW